MRFGPHTRSGKSKRDLLVKEQLRCDVEETKMFALPLSTPFS